MRRKAAITLIVKKKQTAFNKINNLVLANLQSIFCFDRVRSKFFVHIIELWFTMPFRYTFLNMGRVGNYCERTYRANFDRSIDFVSFNASVIKKSCSQDLIGAFDPSFIPKSGKLTPGLGKFWNGTAQSALKGLEISSLAIIDVQSSTAMSLEVVQTPSKEVLEMNNLNLVSHYVSIIAKQLPILKTMIKYLTVDGYFMKRDFVLPLLDLELDVITKMRPDANLNYIYNGKQRKGKGRPKAFDGKVDCQNIDKRRILKVFENDEVIYYSGIVYSISLKRKVRILYLEHRDTKKYQIFMCTDINIEPKLIIEYYKLRFQIEFLIRDAKQHCGLEECQARSEKKLYNHFNFSLTAVTVAKASVWLSLPKQEREAFSMRNIKIMYYNKFITERIFSNLGLDLSCKKIKKLYDECLDIGNLAA